MSKSWLSKFCRDGIAFGGSREGERLLLFDFYEGNVNVKINYRYYLFLLIFIITDIRRWKIELSRYDYQNCPRSGIPRVTRNDGLYTRSRRKRVKLISILALEIAFISVEEKKKGEEKKEKKGRMFPRGKGNCNLAAWLCRFRTLNYFLLIVSRMLFTF